ncbi:Methylmalonic aciduria and homocystinuria type C family [Trinorchestia longiramus]|nr:Methylmalonic aciduria and homocystinuria type C family [Trinorchestia longiramus]
MFEKCFVPFVKSSLLGVDEIQTNQHENDESGRSSSVPLSDPLDKCMKALFKEMTDLLPELKVDVIHDFDMTPMRRPKILVQTVGHISGAVYMYRLEDLKSHESCISETGSSLPLNIPWTSDQKIFPVCLHPRFGGWFALRGVIIFKTVTCHSLARPIPRPLLQSPEEIVKLLELYNNCWRNNAFRDVIPVQEKYSSTQQKYFATPPAKRIELLKQILEKK